MSSVIRTTPVDDRFVHAAATATVAGGAVLAALAVEAAVGPKLGAAWFGLAAIGLAGWVVGLLALRRIGATGRSPAGRVALLVAIIALATFTVAHVVEAVRPDSAVAVFFLGQTIGSLAVMTPVFVLVGHGLAASFFAIAGWGLCWIGLGYALRVND